VSTKSNQYLHFECVLKALKYWLQIKACQTVSLLLGINFHKMALINKSLIRVMKLKSNLKEEDQNQKERENSQKYFHGGMTSMDSWAWDRD